MASGTEFVAECLWPDVRESDLRELDDRVTAVCERLATDGEAVRYIGSMLMREDEVVLCLFRGELEHVTRAADAAAIPYDRMLEAGRSPWPLQRSDTTID
jgi:hypothetical protein